jgi:hypothetical protein
MKAVAVQLWHMQEEKSPSADLGWLCIDLLTEVAGKGIKQEGWATSSQGLPHPERAV